MPILVHMSRIDIVCPILEEERHLVGVLHQMRDIEIANVDLRNVQPLTDQGRVSPAVRHVIATQKSATVSSVSRVYNSQERTEDADIDKSGVLGHRQNRSIESFGGL